MIVASWGGLAEAVVRGMRLPVDGDNVTARVLRTGRSARIDDYATASGSFGTRMRELGIGAAFGYPIVVDGRLWGAMVAAQGQDESLPADTESRVAQFTELIATAISNLQARAEVGRLAEEQAALRRVATLVAEGASPSSVLDAVSAEMEALLEADQVALNRFEVGDEIVVLAHRGLDVARTPVGSRVSIEGESATARVRQTGRPARMEGYESAGGALAELARATGLRSSVSAPISVEGKPWGVITASWKKEESPPPDTEERMVKFTALVATAIANAESREAISQLAGEQAALRRVATLIAQAVPPSELFDAVIEEVGTLLGTDLGGMIHYEADDMVTAVATWAADGEHPPVEGRWSLEGDRLATTIARTRSPAREDDWEAVEGPIAEFVRTVLGIRSSVGCPIIVEGQVWGAVFVHSKQAQTPLPPDTEQRLTNFAELVATAISNAQARAEVGRLAEEQAALRRVATLVAEERPSSEVFAAVAEEVGGGLHLEDTRIVRYEADGNATIVASWGELASALPVGTRVSLGRSDRNRIGVSDRAAQPHRRFHDGHGLLCGLAARARRSFRGRRPNRRRRAALGRAEHGVAPTRSHTGGHRGADGAVHGARGHRNLEHRGALRARRVPGTDSGGGRRGAPSGGSRSARRRAAASCPHGHHSQAGRPGTQGGGRWRAALAEALDQAERATAELRELSHGVLPAILARGGLLAGIEALASRTPVPVDIRVSTGRLPATIEATGYFVVAEALTNVAKHSRASRAEVTASRGQRDPSSPRERRRCRRRSARGKRAGRAR